MSALPDTSLIKLERCPYCGTDQIEDRVLSMSFPVCGQTHCLKCGARGPIKELRLARGAFCAPFTWLPSSDWERIYSTVVPAQRLAALAGRRA